MRKLSIKDGTLRERQFFAWFPVSIERNHRLETRWLETVRVREQFQVLITICGWEKIEFLEPE